MKKGRKLNEMQKKLKKMVEKQCRVCGLVKRHYAKGLCSNCYAREYIKRPEVKDRRREYRSRPEVKAKLKEYAKNYAKNYVWSDKSKARHKEYHKFNVAPSNFVAQFEVYFKRVSGRYSPLIRRQVVNKRAVAELFVDSVCELTDSKKCRLVEELLKVKREKMKRDRPKKELK